MNPPKHPHAPALRTWWQRMWEHAPSHGSHIQDFDKALPPPALPMHNIVTLKIPRERTEIMAKLDLLLEGLAAVDLEVEIDVRASTTRKEEP